MNLKVIGNLLNTTTKMPDGSLVRWLKGGKRAVLSPNGNVQLFDETNKLINPKEYLELSKYKSIYKYDYDGSLKNLVSHKDLDYTRTTKLSDGTYARLLPNGDSVHISADGNKVEVLNKNNEIIKTKEYSKQDKVNIIQTLDNEELTLRQRVVPEVGKK